MLRATTVGPLASGQVASEQMIKALRCSCPN